MVSSDGNINPLPVGNDVSPPKQKLLGISFDTENLLFILNVFHLKTGPPLF